MCKRASESQCRAPPRGPARCPECARQSYLLSGEHRGMPAGAPTFSVIAVETGHALDEWEILAEARASVAFARIDPDTFAIVLEDIPRVVSARGRACVAP